MRHIFIILLLGLSSVASGTTYYVSSSAGLDTNSGTSSVTPWKTLNRVNTFGSFTAGDVILFRRGDTWNETLVPPASGTPGSPIAFDAYGSGPAPVFTAAIGQLPGTGWTTVSGTVQRIDLTPYASTAPSISSPTVNYVEFGNLYGRKQPLGSGCSASIVSKYDWCLLWPYLYVFSTTSNPVAYYGGDTPITPLFSQAAGLSLIYVNGRSWLTFQHIKLQNFDYVGVGVAGAANNLVFANMEADGMVPAGTTPLGFYLNATNPTSIQLLNDDAHLNYDGIRVDSATSTTAISVINCRGYANRDAGLKDNTPGSPHVNYSYSHFYGNGIAQLASVDVISGIAGPGNIPSSTAPRVASFSTYPARFSFTIDDVGSSPGTEAYIDTVAAVFPGFGQGNWKFNAAVVASESVVWPDVNSWYLAGNEIDSHSWSHQYYTTKASPQNAPPKYPDAPAFTMQYTGSGSAATMSFNGTTFSTSVTGAPSDSLSVNLTSAPNNTIGGLVTYIKQQAHYTAADVPTGTLVGSPPLPSPYVRENAHSAELAIVAGVDIKNAPHMAFYDQTRLVPDEMVSSKTAIQGNVTGLTETFYVYPDGLEDPTIEQDAVAAGYTAARGSLAMKDQTNATSGANSLYSNGVNVQNITSLGVGNAGQIHGLSQQQIDVLVANLIFRASVWGAPYGFFTHFNSNANGLPDLSNTELGYLVNSIATHGGTLMTNMALAGAITAGANFSGSTRYIQNPTGAAVNLTAGMGSPTIGAGTNTGMVTAYPIDINGVTRTGAWDIGATESISTYAEYGQGSGGGSYTTIGGSVNYYASSTATTNPGVISSIFSSGQPSGALTSITVSGSTATIVWSGTPLPAGAYVTLSGTSQSACNTGYYTLITSTTFAAGSCVSATGGAATQINGCSGDCQNQWRYDATINPSPLDPYTRITDGTTFNNGASAGCITVSCGDNDPMFSANETYLGVTSAGGVTSVQQLAVNSSGAVQVVNIGKPAIRSAGGPFAFDRTQDAVYYNTGNTNVLSQYTIASINTQPTGTALVDFSAVCPGVPASAFVGANNYMHGILDTGYPGQRYTLYVGPDDTAVWILSYDRTLGCATLNSQTGQYWAFCSGGSCNSSTPASGTLNTTGNSCWGFNLHNGQQTLTEKYYRMSVSLSTHPTEGACAGNSNSTQESLWEIGTANTSWCDGETNTTTGECANHPADGLYGMASNQFQGSNLRSYPFTAGAFTMYAPSLNVEDIHISWAHGPNPGTDLLPWVGAADLVMPTQLAGCSSSAVYCPTWPSNMIVAEIPSAPYPSPIWTFGHTFSCNYTGAAYAHCTGGLAEPFGPGEGIGVLSPRADIFCFASTMLGTLGNDNTGVPRTDAFCIHLQ